MPPFDRVESLFHGSLLLPAGVDRTAWIEAQCQGDDELLLEVRALLEAHARMETANQGTLQPAPGIPAASFGPYRAADYAFQSAGDSAGRGQPDDAWRASP